MRNTKHAIGTSKIREVRFGKRNVLKALLCIGAGAGMFLAAEYVNITDPNVENGRLSRNPCGKGDAVYEICVDGLESDSMGKPIELMVTIPERKMTEEEFRERLPEMIDVLREEIKNENESLDEVRTDLDLVTELDVFGVTVSWDSEQPELVSTMGVVEVPEMEKEEGISVFLEATLGNGIAEEVVEIPMVLYPPKKSLEERFLSAIEELAEQDPEQGEVILPKEFEGRAISYHAPETTGNAVLLLLGGVAAVCMIFKEKSDMEANKKKREQGLMEDYSDLVSEFLILTGAGYSAKAAWKKLTLDYIRTPKNGFHPLYEEMQMTVNQMETGMPETLAYADFGRRCQLRCYIKFASLLEGSVSTGGRNLRKLLENEMEEAFKQRTDLAKRKGEELSSKLLLPMFGMLAVVMVMVVAPAFLSF